MPFCLSLKIKPSYQTLSNALEISKNKARVSQPSSNDSKMLWVMAKSWFIVESPGLKPD